MTTEETIFLSVFSGVVTSALIFLCINIFNKILVPWYAKVIYRGLDISGNWECIQQHPAATDTLKINIIQNEQNIKGTMSVIKKLNNENRVQTKILEIKGFYQDGHLMLIGNSKDKRIRSHMTYLSNIVTGGTELEGVYCIVDSGTGAICPIKATFSRECA